MILYISVILICMLIIATFNVVFNFYELTPTYILLSVVIDTVAVIAVDGLFAFLIRRLPEKWFSHDKKIFVVSKKEKSFYEKLKIRKWKDKIPELGSFTGFHKNKVVNPFDNTYLSRYLLEAGYGIVIHFVTAFTGFLIVFIHPLGLWLNFAFGVAIVNFILNLLPVFVLRYNYYKLKVLYTSNEKKQKEKQYAIA